MHMSDALVSTTVGITMAAASTGMIGYSVKKMNNTDLSDNKIPMMGVMGAFIFAAQMINFTIPGTGSSGHIGGGILLAALLGPYPAFLTLASVLIIQALIFADGGLLALGCNIFNLGFFPCLVAFPLIYRPMLKKIVTKQKIMIVSIISVILGLQLGSFAVVMETSASGVIKLPFTAFLALMQPIHLVIGIIEGVATGAILGFVYGARKEIITNALIVDKKLKSSKKMVLLCFIAATILFGGFVSLYASSKPDGLEWSIQGMLGSSEVENTSEVHEQVQKLQDKTTIFPDYSFAGESPDSQVGTSVSGIVGSVLTLVITITAGFIILIFKKRKRKNTDVKLED